MKARIVQKYFNAWANVITAVPGTSKIAYIDLYAGPGRYEDGAASTPLMILENAINHPKISQMLVAFFNDVDKNLTDTLQAEIDKLNGIEKLKYRPQVLCGEVDRDAEAFFNSTRLIPSFTFVDPFGYRGLSLGIINGVIKDWGCDCVFFFNYNRINAGLTNPAVKHHIDALFGAERADAMRNIAPTKAPALREAYILEEMSQAIKKKGGRFVLPFVFKNEMGTRTSHSLIFVTKNFKGYEIMKDIMAKESSSADQGVPSFTYSPADESMPLLFSLNTPLDKLEGLLLEKYAGRTLVMDDIYREHSVDRPYIKKNYKDALLSLEEAGKILAEPPLKAKPPAKGRRAGTFGDAVKVSFPARNLANG